MNTRSDTLRDSDVRQRQLSTGIATKAWAVADLRTDVLSGEMSPREIALRLQVLERDLAELSGVALRLESKVNHG